MDRHQGSNFHVDDVTVMIEKNDKFQYQEFDATERDDPPCPMGQQLIGFLFGLILSYIAMLGGGCSCINYNVCKVLMKVPLPSFISVIMAIGIAFGTVGSRVANPFNLNKFEFMIMFAVALVFSSFGCILMNICGDFGMTDRSSDVHQHNSDEHRGSGLFGLLLVSLLSSTLSGSVRNVLLFSGYFYFDAKMAKVCTV